MSGLASLLYYKGFTVQGSDKVKSEFTTKLEKLGIKVYYHHSLSNINNANIIVINSAIKDDNEELIYAKKNNLLILTRSELLGLISSDYKNVIAVSGAHGKTTTTSLIGEIFSLSGLKPTIHAGGIMKKFDSSFVVGESKYFITEACEYKDSFLSLNPTLALILNVEKEHLDYFKNYDNVKKSFYKFATKSNKIITNSTLDYSHDQITIGKDYLAKNIKYKKQSTNFEVYKNDKKFLSVKLKAFGAHNVKNALYAVATADYYGIDKKIIVKALNNFSGVKRRFDIIKQSPLIIHDYAHHPDEIKSIIETVRNFSKDKIIVVFQPHTYSRTKKLMNEFVNVLSVCDEICIFKTYSAREKYDSNGSARALYNKLTEKKENVSYFINQTKMREYIYGKLDKNSQVIVLGAGNIEKFAYSLK